ncbi:MAG: nuclease (SNase domain protein) [Candidatus Saccharibacteria bacterium]|jgi:micrococcal nuclease|nr:nuclease (SNase domain protein) [Candidatus Saccharibacteria bacterium]
MDEELRKYARRRLRRKRGSVVTALLALIILIVATLNQPATTQKPPANPSTKPTVQEQLEDVAGDVLDAQPGQWHVTQVIDGDTIEVKLDGRLERVRLLGIDTPETHDPRKPVQCFGEAAAAHATALLKNQNVRLEPDPLNSDRDKYLRLLRYVYLPDGTLVNAALIRDGYAFAYTVFPLTRLEEFRALEAEARTAGRGLWGGCNVDDSKDIKQTTEAR